LHTLLFSLLSFLAFLAIERILLNRALRRIPVRIAVTGTRGKSGVTRTLASVLTESGRKVVAKTTGSEAVMLLPSGIRREIRRRGIPSILEQVSLLRKASAIGADCVVAEIMSLRPENHYIEAQQILKPGIVVVTNVRLDHTEVMGGRVEDIAEVLSLDVPPGATVFVPDGAPERPFAKAIAESGGKLHKVAPAASTILLKESAELTRMEFSGNLDLVYSVSRHLGIDDRTILEGILKARHDIGQLRVWRVQSADKQKSFYLVNAFAANDPESTLDVLARVLRSYPAGSRNVTGVLNLRLDRGARTLQWIEALNRGGLQRFRKLFVTGGHAAYLKRHVPGTEVLRGKSAPAMTETLLDGAPDGAVIFGFGNVKGCGERLIRYWNTAGDDYGL
jgi:gamma-polyglutamate synthase